MLIALDDDHRRRLVGGLRDGGRSQRHVGNHAAGLDAAGGGDQQLGRGVVDAAGKLVGGEAAEDHRMDGAQARTSEHGDDRLGDHRHIDDNAVAFLNAMVGKHGGKGRHVVEQFAIADLALGGGDRAVVDDRRLLGAAALNMAVERVVAGVALRACEPAPVDTLIGIEGGVPRRRPLDRPGGLGPEADRIVLPARIGVRVSAHSSPPARA